jgi:hypothetical protein
LGDPLPTPVSTPDVAEVTMAFRTVDGAAEGLPWRYRAATPAVCGEAIDVPLIVFVAVLLVCHVDVMLEPDANKSRHVP